MWNRAQVAATATRTDDVTLVAGVEGQLPPHWHQTESPEGIYYWNDLTKEVRDTLPNVPSGSF